MTTWVKVLVVETHSKAWTEASSMFLANKVGAMADERGQQCVIGSYMPAWCGQAVATYKVQGKWPEALWKHFKLEDAVCKEYLYLARDGVQARKKSLVRRVCFCCSK